MLISDHLKRDPLSARRTSRTLRGAHRRRRQGDDTRRRWELVRVA